jgi:hypothetical protein
MVSSDALTLEVPPGEGHDSDWSNRALGSSLIFSGRRDSPWGSSGRQGCGWYSDGSYPRCGCLVPFGPLPLSRTGSLACSAPFLCHGPAPCVLRPHGREERASTSSVSGRPGEWLPDTPHEPAHPLSRLHVSALGNDAKLPGALSLLSATPISPCARRPPASASEDASIRRPFPGCL